MKNLTYKGTGVDYDAMDPFKRLAQQAGLRTEMFNPHVYKEVEMSRGESVYLVDANGRYLAHVEEGLGTKNLVADAMYKLTGKSYYDNIAQDTVAMIVNDMITLGAYPLSVAMHLAVGSGDWFKDEKRSNDLITGWEKACNIARCAWGGGETPTLKDIIIPDTVVLSGSAIGTVPNRDKLIKCNIQDDDIIVMIGSSGIHANGLTLARKIAEKLPDGYLTKLPNGRTYGDTLLDPTIIYVPLVEDCIEAGVDIHYAVNITGHGWRKLMRASQPFAYILDQSQIEHPRHEIFDFICKHGPVDIKEAYANFNMGFGFALYVKEKDFMTVCDIAHKLGIYATRGGHIEKSDEKKVVIPGLGIEYTAETLAVR